MAQTGRLSETRGAPGDLASILVTQLPAAPIVSLDFRFETLKGFLDSVVQTVNQHAQVIRVVAGEVKTKASVVEISEALTIVCAGIPSSLVDRPPPADFNSVKETAQRAAFGVTALGKHVAKLKEFEEATRQSLAEIHRQLDTKASTENVKKRVKKSRKKMEDKLEERFNELNASILALQKTLWEKVSAQDKKISDLEVSTLWKLKDVEELLKSRVNEKFVWDAVNATIGKGRKDVKDLGLELHAKIDKLTKELQERVGRAEDTDRDSTAQLRKLVAELEDQIKGKCEMSDVEERMNALLQQVDPAGLRQKFEELMARIDKLNQRVTAFSEQTQLKKEVDWMGEELKRLGNRINVTQEDVAKKVDTEKFKEALASLLANLPKGHSGPSIDPADLNNMRDRMMDQIKALEKKFDKFARSLDLKGILSQLGLKANTEDVDSAVGKHESTLVTHEQAINDLARELEQLKLSLQKVVTMVQDASVTNNSLLSRRPMGSSTCLSCGRGEAKFAPMLPAVMGSDGRVYRADGNLMKVASGPVTDFEPMYDVGAEVFSIDTHEQMHIKTVGPQQLEEVRGSKLSVQLSPQQSRSQTLRAPLNVILGTVAAREESILLEVQARGGELAAVRGGSRRSESVPDREESHKQQQRSSPTSECQEVANGYLGAQ